MFYFLDDIVWFYGSTDFVESRPNIKFDSYIWLIFFDNPMVYDVTATMLEVELEDMF